MKTCLGVSVLAFMFAGLATFGQTSIDTPEFQARRKAALEKVPDGIVLLHTSWGLKRWDESGFHQDPSFYYFTGLANAHGAILALDGTKKESWLFVPPRIPIFPDLQGFDSVFIEPGPPTEKDLGIDHVVAWDQFATFIESRGKDNPKLVLYTDQEVKRARCQATANSGLLRGWARYKTRTSRGPTCCAKNGAISK
jgi:Aminopeptidase P, N-terminal domain